MFGTTHIWLKHAVRNIKRHKSTRGKKKHICGNGPCIWTYFNIFQQHPSLLRVISAAFKAMSATGSKVLRAGLGPFNIKLAPRVGILHVQSVTSTNLGQARQAPYFPSQKFTVLFLVYLHGHFFWHVAKIQKGTGWGMGFQIHCVVLSTLPLRFLWSFKLLMTIYQSYSHTHTQVVAGKRLGWAHRLFSLHGLS